MSRLGRRFWSGKPFTQESVLAVPHWSGLEGRPESIRRGQGFVPGWGMSCLSTGMTGSSTAVEGKWDMWSTTTMVAKSTRITSLPSWTCGPRWIHSLQCGTEWRLLGGVGLRKHHFFFSLSWKHTDDFFFLWGTWKCFPQARWHLQCPRDFKQLAPSFMYFNIFSLFLIPVFLI